MAKMLQEDSVGQSFMQAINGPGIYDGSSNAETVANNLFSKLERTIGCHNYRTRIIFDEVLRSSNLPMTLLTCYAFAVGEYIENPDYEPYGLNTPEANNNYQASKIMLPDYARFVESRHSGTEAVVIQILTGNLLPDVADIPFP